MKKTEYKEPLIGKKIKVTESKNTSIVGLQGKVIDETKNTVLITTEKGDKRLLKDQIKFIIKEEGVKINGNKIQKRLEERIK